MYLPVLASGAGHPPVVARLAPLFALAWTFALPTCVGAQRSAELEFERDEQTSVLRAELLHDRFYVFRAERRRIGGRDLDRVGFQFPGSMIGLTGYGSAFLENHWDYTGMGSNVKFGRGPVEIGGSLERAGERRFTGAFATVGGEDWKLGFGGGDRNSEAVWHGAGYVKGTRFSAAVGGSVGPANHKYSHYAATWHPAPEQRGHAPGAWIQVERDGPRDYEVELNLAHGANLGFMTTWGGYGMDEFPHEKRIIAMGDFMRYYRPPTRNHERSAGAGVLGARYRVLGDDRWITLDVRFYPFRMIAETDRTGGPVGAAPRRNVGRDVLRGMMIGLMQPLRSSDHPTVLVEVRVDPIVVYSEIRTGAQSNGYVYLQYVVRGLF